MANGPRSHTVAGNTTEPSADTSVDQNKAVSRRWIDVFNARDDTAEADVRAPDYVAHAPASLEPAPLSSETWDLTVAVASAAAAEAFSLMLPKLPATLGDAS